MRKYVLLLLAFISVFLITVNRKNLSIQNNLSALYKMKGRLKTDTILASQVLNYTPSSWFILKAQSAEELLQKEEEFSSRFESLSGKDGKPDTNYICTSKIIPSKKRQKKSLEACLSLANSSLAIEQFELLDFEKPENLQKNLIKTISTSKENFILPDSPLPKQLESIVKLLWLGNIDGSWYSVFMPTKNAQKDSSLLKSLSDPESGIFFQEKVRQIGESLDGLSKSILKMFFLAYIIILFLLRLFFNASQTAKIAAVPVFSLLAILAVFTATKTPIDFFCITGIILVFGLGIDYIIYMTSHKGGKLEKTAIILSFLTTAISFGTLALSSFVPIHAIGTAIFTGLTAAFLATLFL